MITFKAHYINNLGFERHQRIEAEDEVSAIEKIEGKGGMLIELVYAGADDRADKRLKIDLKSLLICLEGLTLMLEVGAKVDVSLRSAFTRTSNPQLRKFLGSATREVERNGKISEAFARFPRVFSPSMIYILRNHEQQGDLRLGLQRVTGYYHRLAELQGDVKKALLMPGVSMVAFVVAAAVIFGNTLPKFKKFITEMVPMDQLSLLSQVFFGISDFVVAYPWLCVGGVIGLPIAAWQLMQIARVRLWLFELGSRLPVVGPALSASALARFCETYATLARSGIKTVETLEMTGAVVGHPGYERAVARVRLSILNNNLIADAFLAEKTFPEEFRTGVAMGADDLAGVFEKLARHYVRESKNRISIMVASIEPLMVVLLGGFVLMAALSIILPIIALINAQSTAR